LEYRLDHSAGCCGLRVLDQSPPLDHRWPFNPVRLDWQVVFSVLRQPDASTPRSWADRGGN